MENSMMAWQSFYNLAGTGAATLMGLMFLAVTFGARLATKESMQIARSFLDPIILHFICVFLISEILLMPEIGANAISLTLLVISLVRLLGLSSVARNLIKAHKKNGDLEASDWIAYVLAPLTIYTLLLVSAYGFYQASSWAPQTLAVTVLLFLLVGVQGSWELLVWIAATLGGDADKAP